ncbi:MAG: carbamate kinase [Candidatus Nephthysia bennettiae]|uniref:Carbamate kinase n=1 Tax=Candidatus Nephthysia bennettiae TaxID=3127016 RepID=A0A934K3N5_9BACT|nr:carbamate kinase [Candidatus Dormibacteraeota bacterium]MBJ7615040.1 carbamate kinase [Candidatus Dormibacteraeota bacterium]PZR93252.1 MAG: carbamate kinase [Candidatus Dormibacteraeota bacterium]
MDYRAQERASERYVIALGGNALIPPGGRGTAEEQTSTVASAMGRLAPLVAAGAQLVITHGNGPQVGNLLLKNELAADLVPPMPLDWCVAQTQATIGLAIQTALEWELRHLSVSRRVVVVLTRVLVDPLDPNRLRYTKPIGRRVSAEDAAALADLTHHYAEQPGGGWRRVVPSPEPAAIQEESEIRQLLEGGAVVIAAGGGGVPVEVGEDGRLFGVEAVIDKDLTASLLARRLAVDTLVILTDASGAAINFGTRSQRLLQRVTPSILRGFQSAGHFSEGSMGPKVEAALRFVEAGGRRAVIAGLDDAAGAVAGERGTQVIAR